MLEIEAHKNEIKNSLRLKGKKCRFNYRIAYAIECFKSGLSEQPTAAYPTQYSQFHELSLNNWHSCLVSF